EGRAIQLHPLVCKGFNADFDGDQMAVHLPLSDEAQAEARDIMVADRNLLKPADGTPILHIEQDMVLGCYYLTYERSDAAEKARAFESLDEALMAVDAGVLKLQSFVRLPFRGSVRETTVGRLLFNETFPEDFPFQDEPMTKKRLQRVMALAYTKYGQEKTAEIADELKTIGFSAATASGISMGMEDFNPVVGMDKVVSESEAKAAAISDQYEQGFITEDERYRLTVENWTKADARVQELLAEQLSSQSSTMAIAITS